MEHLSRGLHRINLLCQSAAAAKLRILVDAEYTYLNPGISVVALAMMRLYNGADNPRPLVGNTYQCYLRVCART